MMVSPFAQFDFAAIPPALESIRRETEALGFTMASSIQTGAMLRALAAGKPGGRILELGTGTGAGTVWLLAGMNATATLDTVDNEAACVAVARRNLGHDRRLRFHVGDGGAFLRDHASERFDLIFADTWPGKFTDLDVTLSLLNPGGIYVIDDLFPQASWPADHEAKVSRLLRELAGRTDLTLWPIRWDTGVIVAVKNA